VWCEGEDKSDDAASASSLLIGILDSFSITDGFTIPVEVREGDMVVVVGGVALSLLRVSRDPKVWLLFCNPPPITNGGVCATTEAGVVTDNEEEELSRAIENRR